MESDENIRVSVIVPIYNSGSRIYKCMDTLVNQTLKDIEIICVLDCPTDGSDQVVEEYARNDSRIVILRNDRNLHVNGSRNKGMMMARGEYIGFSDHDDFRELDMYEVLYAKALETHADIVISDAKIIHENGIVENCQYGNPTKEGIINSILLPMNHKKNLNILSKSVWHSLYKRTFVEKNQICFENRNTYLEEDTLFNLRAYLMADTIAYCPVALYCWNKHVDSESNRRFAHEEVVKRQLNSLVYIGDLLKSNVCFGDYKEPFYITLSDCINRYFQQYKSLLGEERRKFISLINTTCYPLFGRYNLKLISKKRLKLFFFVLKLKLDGRKL